MKQVKILLDTNVLLDAIAARAPFCEDAERIFLLAAHDRFEGFLTANAMTDIYYVARRTLPEEGARNALRTLLQLFTLVDVRGVDCETALDLPMRDYEDALAVICARRAGITHIVTRDEDFLESTSHPITLSPRAFLEMLDNESNA